MDSRKILRNKRRALSPDAQRTAAHGLLSQFLKLPFLKNVQYIAVYMPFDGEIDPVFIMEWCIENDKFLYLPKINISENNNSLKFLLFKKNKMLKYNKFNILEPSESDTSDILPEQLELILLPLVAFDRQCHRLGMGKGYYDKTLKNTKNPFLIGLGYDFQCLENIIPHENDVQMDGILTDKEMILRET
jgi:5-formyltetrahydrofolate cyclo-ligase